MTATTPGLVCAHHHLYSALARGMPAPPKTATTFQEVLEQIWWRLDVALDLEMIRWSAMLGALEALESGTTAIVDHHETPKAIEGSLDVNAAAFPAPKGRTASTGSRSTEVSTSRACGASLVRTSPPSRGNSPSPARTGSSRATPS